MGHTAVWLWKDKLENVSLLIIQQTNMESLTQHNKAFFQSTQTND